MAIVLCYATAPQRHSAPPTMAGRRRQCHTERKRWLSCYAMPLRHCVTAPHLRWRVEENKDTMSARAETITAGQLNRHTNSGATRTNYGDLSYRQRSHFFDNPSVLNGSFLNDRRSRPLDHWVAYNRSRPVLPMSCPGGHARLGGRSFAA